MFKENFIRLCNQNDVSPSAVCRAVGIAPATFSCWTEESVPRKATLIKIADYFGVSVDDLLGKGNTSTVKNKKNILRVPVYGQVAAGIPIDAIEDIDDYEELDADQYSPGEYFALRIKGHSMEPRITNGDVVIVRQQPDAETGDIAIVMVNGGEATCKKIKKTPEGIWLISTNPSYEPMIFSNTEIETLPVKILGKVIELRAKF